MFWDGERAKRVQQAKVICVGLHNNTRFNSTF